MHFSPVLLLTLYLPAFDWLRDERVREPFCRPFYEFCRMDRQLCFRLIEVHFSDRNNPPFYCKSIAQHRLARNHIAGISARVCISLLFMSRGGEMGNCEQKLLFFSPWSGADKSWETITLRYKSWVRPLPVVITRILYDDTLTATRPIDKLCFVSGLIVFLFVFVKENVILKIL